MLMRIVWREFDPQTWERLVADFLSLTPEHLGIRGLRARWLLRDTDDSRVGFIISLWDETASTLQYAAHPRMIQEHGDFYSHELQAFHGEICSEWHAPAPADGAEAPAPATGSEDGRKEA